MDKNECELATIPDHVGAHMFGKLPVTGTHTTPENLIYCIGKHILASICSFLISINSSLLLYLLFIIWGSLS